VDVHSYALILWAIYAREEPFKGYAYFDLLKHIVNDGRPEIPQYCSSSLARLMSDCWMSRPDNRPTMQEVSIRVQQIEIEERSTQLLAENFAY